MSFAGNVTFKNADALRAAAAVAPPELMLAETDAPYLTPVPHRGKPNSPAMTAHTIRYLAALKDMDVADFCADCRPLAPVFAGSGRVGHRDFGAGSVRQRHMGGARHGGDGGAAAGAGGHPGHRGQARGPADQEARAELRRRAGDASGRSPRWPALRPGDVILEVGPGLGSLTLALLEAAVARPAGRAHRAGCRCGWWPSRSTRCSRPSCRGRSPSARRRSRTG